VLCSPSTHRIASATFDLPEPLGPTTAVTPRPYSNVVRFAKLLNPWVVSRFRYTGSGLRLRLRAQRCDGLMCGRLLRFTFAPSLTPAEGGALNSNFNDKAVLDTTRFLHRHIFGRFMPASLDQVLQGTFGVEAGAVSVNLFQFRFEQAADQRLGGAIAARAIDRADHGLKGACEVLVARPAARSLFTAAENQLFTEPQP